MIIIHKVKNANCYFTKKVNVKETFTVKESRGQPINVALSQAVLWQLVKKCIAIMC